MTSLLDDQRLSIVQQSLLNIGYDPQAIVANYDFAVPGEGDALYDVDLAAFSDPVRHDLHTSCMAAQRVGPDTIQSILSKLSFLATPIALLLHPDGVDIWPVTNNGGTQRLDQVPYDRLTQYFMEHARDFRPDAVAAAKTKGHQLSFFDVDRTLLEFAYESTQGILVDRFETAVNAAKYALGERDSNGPHAAIEVAKAALQILAAAILEDKGLLGDERSSTAEDLIQRAAGRYGQYFDVYAADRIGHDVAQLAFEALRKGVTFRSFTNEMLGYFYENTFVDKELRRDLGIYYTPRSIAKRILNRLPIEDIPPTERVVFDGSSGSGNLLLAAYERLADLTPSGWDGERKHDYLVKRIHGVDVDQFATQVARLSLFFINLPAGDAWDVTTADFTKTELRHLHHSPSILVGNPPFEELRSVGGKRVQRASAFLERYLDLLSPQGLLGIVLPETFLENSSCRDARRRLLTECDVLELWHLPEGIFPMSSAATVVVLAKKLPVKGPQHMPIRVEKVASLTAERKQFLDGYPPRFSYIVSSTRSWVESPAAIVSSSPLQRAVWDGMRVSGKIEDVATVRNGVIPGKNQRQDHFDDKEQGPEWRPWLSGASDLEPYQVKPRATVYVNYPGNLHRPRLDLEHVFASPNAKILVNSARAPGNPWRIYAAIDDFGYIPSQNLHCVIPKAGIVSLPELVAFLNSSVASAWVDSRNRRRWIDEQTLRDMPFPAFTDRVRKILIAHVDLIQALKREALADTPMQHAAVVRIRELSLSIDELICDSFDLNDEARRALKELFDGYRRPGIEWSGYGHSEQRTEPPTSDGRKWPVTGQVIEVGPDAKTLMMWVRGYNDSQPFEVAIPSNMPGWALRPDAAFQAEIPWDRRDSERLRVDDLAGFRPLDFSYSEPEELVALLQNQKTLDDIYGR